MPLMVEINNKSEIKHFSRANLQFSIYYYSTFAAKQHICVPESEPGRASYDKFTWLSAYCELRQQQSGNTDSPENDKRSENSSN